ncbi:hypothetical protein VE04_02700 [Pseudogymnoascus sp. 24MN13]|nr:hypothetical protein VE04_02700 [Pseudogymnoascus sp. 24MN13]
MVGVLHRTGWSGRGAAAISLDRFIASLQQLNHKGLNQLTENTNGKPCKPLTIGLAISGGVDSMALASLCSRIQSKDRFKFRAFVVDHKVRAGSGDEAHAVAKILGEKDIPTDVLKIEWPEGLNPKEASNFESLARTYRFQALGKACRDHGIQSLFLAHHRDDQAETVLMRMINGHRKDGLCGMRLSGDIPECRGIYGVHQSGVVDASAPASQLKFGRGIDLDKSRSLDSSDDTISSSGMKIESGGIKVYRPLLCFTKQELRDTCEANDMSWFEDKTNADPTLTMRNAIRHIYANNKLPVALQKPSILALAKRLQENRDRDVERRNKSFAQKVQILKFEPSVPYCSVYFEPLDMEYNAKSSAGISSTEFEDASWWLRAVIQLISPVENIALGTLSTAVQRIYPELGSQVGHDSAPRKAFTVAGVMFEPAPSHTHDSRLLSSHTDTNPTASEGSTLAHQQIANRHWIIRPQPFKRGKEPRLDFIPFQGKDEEAYWRDNDSWKLFDGRFWIRILNLTSTNIYLRPFQAEDVHKLKGTKFMEQLEQREKLLLPLKASKFRYVLPAIVAEVDGTERVVGLPTLGILAQDFENLVKYEVRYRGLGSWPN